MMYLVTIYKDTHEHLRKLGLSGRPLASLINNLHIQAVKSLTSIIGTRRHSERAQHQHKLRYGQPAPNPPHTRRQQYPYNRHPHPSQTIMANAVTSPSTLCFHGDAKSARNIDIALPHTLA